MSRYRAVVVFMADPPPQDNSFAIQRANHTGTQLASTVSDFTEAAQDAVAGMLTSGANVTLSYDDAGNSLSITASGTDAEVVRDTIGAALVGVQGVTVAVNDAADTITFGITGLSIAQTTGLQAALDAKVASSRNLVAGTGLTGGGDLSADRTLAVSYGTTAGSAAQGNDSRLSDARTPTAHAASHVPGASDPLTGYVDTTTAQTAAGNKTFSGVTSFTNAIAVNAGIRSVTATITVNATIAANVGGPYRDIDATAGSLTVTLPSVTSPGYVYEFTKVDATVNTATLAGTFNGQTGFILSHPGQAVRIASTTTAGVWRVISPPTPMFSLYGPATVVNTAVETSIFNGGTGYGSRTLPAGALATRGAAYLLGLPEVSGSYQTGTIADQVEVRAKLGTTNVGALNVAASVLATSSTVNPLSGYALIRVVDVSGTTSRISCVGAMTFGIAADQTTMLKYTTAKGVAAGLLTGSSGFTGALATVDVTNNVTQVFDITEKWASARAGQGTTMTEATLKKIA